jgi:hypothetical protein
LGEHDGGKPSTAELFKLANGKKNGGGVYDRVVSILSVVALVTVWFVRDSESYNRDVTEIRGRIEKLEKTHPDVIGDDVEDNAQRINQLWDAMNADARRQEIIDLTAKNAEQDALIRALERRLDRPKGE